MSTLDKFLWELEDWVRAGQISAGAGRLGEAWTISAGDGQLSFLFVNDLSSPKNP